MNNKTKRFNLRLTEKEDALLRARADRMGMTVSKYVLWCCLNKKIYVINGMDELNRQLKAVGNNLNQLENIEPQTAHEIVLKFAETFVEHEIVVATHTDGNHIHSHFILNSVNMDGTAIERIEKFSYECFSVYRESKEVQ